MIRKCQRAHSAKALRLAGAFSLCTADDGCGSMEKTISALFVIVIKNLAGAEFGKSGLSHSKPHAGGCENKRISRLIYLPTLRGCGMEKN